MWSLGLSFTLSVEHFFSIKHRMGLGTNNRAELFSLWILLKTAADKGLSELQVMRDPNLLMDWANGFCRINNLPLLPIMNRVSEVKKHV